MPTEDKTEEVLSKLPWADEPEEGSYFYAYDYHPNTDWAWWSFKKEGQQLGITGFTD